MANDLVGQVAGQLGGKMFSSILWLGTALIVGLFVVGLMYYFLIYRRKFDIRVKVISERAGDKNKVFFDKAAIITERQSKTKFFRIWGLKVDLPVPKFNVIQSVGEGRGVVDYLELYRKSEEDFYFLTPSKISGTQIIKADGKLHYTPER